MSTKPTVSASKPASRLKGMLALTFVMFTWASTFTVTKSIINTIPPFYFAFLRFVVASVVLIIFYLIRGKKSRSSKTPLPYGILTLMGIFGVTLYYILFNLSMIYTSASSGALIQGFGPIFIVVMAVIFLKERLTIKEISGVVLSVIGVIMIGFIAEVHNDALNSFLGNWLMIGAIAAWGAYTILSKKIAKIDTLTVTCISTVIGTVLLFPAVVFELWHKPLPVITSDGWWAIIYLGVLPSAFSFFLYNNAMESLTASEIGVFTNIDPVVGAIIAVIFLNEDVNAWQIAGTILVLAGIWLSTHKPKSAVSG
jgi:drug/metabolite transporter (DMT)-like permease